MIVLVKLSWKSGNTKYTTFIYKMSKSNYLTINTTKIKQVELIFRGAGERWSLKSGGNWSRCRGVSFFLLKQECDGEIYLAAYVEGWFYLLDEAFPVCRCVFVR